METQLRRLKSKWSKHAELAFTDRPILVLSTRGLNAIKREKLKQDIVKELSTDGNKTLLSVIISMKMNHIYFRLNNKTYDYRPHRGAFSRIAESDYRIAKSDRSEILLTLTELETKQLEKYIQNIMKNREAVLGPCWPFSLVDPNFSVYSYHTNGSLNNNHLKDKNVKHNCLTWLTTAPIGENGQNLISLLNMQKLDIDNEVHSYIVQFYRFLLKVNSKNRAPAVLLWTKDEVKSVKDKLEKDRSYLTEFYTPTQSEIQRSA